MYRPFLRNSIILVVLFFITYALADSINNYNALGIFLALGSLGALWVCIYLVNQLTQSAEEEEV
ncbi:hypothetical protein [Sediminibacterium soli]|uniref:hypothetical protein n=1 Tax=Sediminibacterium soli TaxID=2698829 RepID=UPI0013799CF4|nr:hypothetical protein [Sediminibacterium soli]NCI46014.1 hypothetical protein [Sediminibacterium soli]